MAAQAERPPAGPDSGGTSWLWPVTGLVVLLAVVGYVVAFGFLVPGDGAVAVDSEALRVATAQAQGRPGTASVLRDPAGTMTIGFPVTNRGQVPVTITDVQAADAAAGEAGCSWRVVAVRTSQQGAPTPPGVVQPFGSVRLPAGRNIQLYVEAGFPPQKCDAASRTAGTVDALVVSYEVFGLLPRTQEIPLTVPVTTVLNPDDPALADW